MLSIIFPKKINPELKIEQMRMLCKQKRGILLASILVAGVSTFIFWPVADHNMLLIWFFTVISISAIRLFLTRIPNYNLTKRWKNIHFGGIFITGLSWGALAFFFDPLWASHYQVSLFVIFVGVISAAFTSNSPMFSSFITFLLPVIFCLIYVLSQQETEGFVKIIFLIIAYTVFMYTAALKYNGQLLNLLEMQFSNAKLSNMLLESNIKLENMAETDSLTGLFNRRSLDKKLKAEWSRHLRNKRSLSFLFIDADYFKQYNDTYGHDEGDKCLKQIANVLKKNASRSSDIAARYGGEEFCVVLPETEGNNAVTVAEKIRSAMQELKIPHSGSSVSEYVTISIGISSMVPDKNNDADNIRVLADKALYQAKNNGRNQSVLSDEASI